jgi:N4-(beta-N-acetylglucosaminyl)-L-asparaginase
MVSSGPGAGPPRIGCLAEDLSMKPVTSSTDGSDGSRGRGPKGSGVDRRAFLQSSAVAAAASSLFAAPAVLKRAKEPVVVGSANAHPACTAKAMELLKAGKPPLEAVIAGVNIVEDDPNDDSVGYGGLPNEAGVVELDSSVMDGPSGLSGAVAALQNIKNPSKVAKKVLEETDHALLVGAGALAFAKAHGFKEEDLLTESSRQLWLYWRQKHSDHDDWLPGKDVPERIKKIIEDEYLRPTGTINCGAVDQNGDLAGCTSTSGLAFKIPGRVGDSPIIGAGLYVDNAYGAAGSTGRGEANIITNGSHVVVESLRQGLHPTDACLAACKRVVEFTRSKHLLAKNGRPNFNVKYYCVDKSGRHGSASLYAGGKYAVNDEKGNRLEDSAFVFDKR